ncbi:GntR family transcriptional regulator [Microbacterium karelineae]|uniref:GntR family transcriptional regulator n=1 Tax=Microbacterium karelineae TaxID=2654283 RepID=UPI0012E9DEE0|nr:GntR family transcriptional regulator [Microbacterium karelineae]
MATARTVAARLDSDGLADELRREISAGELAPNQRLIEADIVEQYGVSRSVVRTALANLAVEGMVERVQNRGARVRAIDADEALEILELRASIESLCAAHAARNATDAQLAELAEVGERMRACVDAGDAEGYSACNRALHDLVLDLSGMRLAPTIVNRLRAQHARFRIKLARTHNRPRVSFPEHMAIIDAIRARDADAAAAAMSTHLRSVQAATREHFVED